MKLLISFLCIFLGTLQNVLSTTHSEKFASKDYQCNNDPARQVEFCNFSTAFESGNLSIKATWKILKNNLAAITAGLNQSIADFENHPDEALSSCFKHKERKEATKQLLLIYSQLLQFRLVSQTLFDQKPNLSVHIPNMRDFQRHFTNLWRSVVNFKFSDPEELEETIIVRYAGYGSPDGEMSLAMRLERLLRKCVETSDYDVQLSGSGFNFFERLRRRLTVLLQILVVGNVGLYSIQQKYPLLHLPIDSAIIQDPKIFVKNVDSIVRPVILPGIEYILESMRNINFATTLISYFIDDSHTEELSKVSFTTAMRTVKTMFYEDLKVFINTGNPSSIVSRLLLRVIEKNKDKEGAIDYIMNRASELYQNIDNLTYPERPQEYIAKEIRVQKDSNNVKNFIKKTATSRNKPNKNKKQPKKNCKTSRNKNKKKEIPSNPFQKRSLRVRKRFVDSDESFSDAIKQEAIIIEPSIYYLEIGQFCYDHVLFPLLGKLGLVQYTWKQVSEACFTPTGFEALAALVLTQSQVDVCIAIVRDRVVFAHPLDVTPEKAQDDTIILKQAHPELTAEINTLQQRLFHDSGWKVGSGLSIDTPMSATFIEPSKLTLASMRVAEYCWTAIAEPIAVSFGLDIYSTSMRDLTDHCAIHELDTSLLVACQSLIKLRNTYVHKGVSPFNARRALYKIYGDNDEMQKMSILQPIFDRVQESQNEGMEFY